MRPFRFTSSSARLSPEREFLFATAHEAQLERAPSVDAVISIMLNGHFGPMTA